MWGRKVTNCLLKKFLRASQFASPSSTAQPIVSSGEKILASQSRFRHRKSKHESVLWMLLRGQTAILIGGSCSLVFAEEVSPGIASANDSENVGLQLIEDGSVISNEHTSKWRIFTDNGRDFFMQGKFIEAEKLFSSALVEAKEGFGERDPHVASALNNLAELYRVRKSYDKAEPLYLDAIRILEEAYGSEDVRVGAAVHNLGQFYIVQRKFEVARSCYERALKIKGRVLGHGHPDYAETMFHLGTVLYLQGNVDDAEVLIKDSILILEEGGQGESYSCTRKLRYLAKIYMNKNSFEEAENALRKILHIMELTKGWKSLDTVIIAETLAGTLQSKGQLQDARELLERCLNVRRELLPKDHIQIGANMLSLANVTLLNLDNLRNTAPSELLVELNQAKELLKDSIRVAEKALDATRKERKIQKLEHGRNEQQIALVILLRSLKAMATLEKTKYEIQNNEKALPIPEAEKVLRQCVRAFKEYGAESYISVEPKLEYVSCLNTLLKLIADCTENTDKSRTNEMEDLKGEISRVEAEISSFRMPNV